MQLEEQEHQGGAHLLPTLGRPLPSCDMPLVKAFGHRFVPAEFLFRLPSCSLCYTGEEALDSCRVPDI
jgi:hypothetical protein